MSTGEKTILLVEDDRAHAGLIRRAFDGARMPVVVRTASTLAEARFMLGTELPDMAIVDLVLPDGRGTDLFEDTAAPPPIPVVIMTSHGDEQVAVEAIKAGAIDYVVKSESTFIHMPYTAESALREWELIRQKNEALEALRESEERFRAITENSTDITLILDSSGVARYVSPSAMRIGGYAVHEILGRRPAAFVHPDDLAKVNRSLAATRGKPGKANRLDSFRVRHRRGHYIFLEGLFVHMPDAPGVEGMVINCRNITQRKKAESELESYRAHLEELVRERTSALLRSEEKLNRAERLASLGTLAAGIAHEINNPIGAILLYAQTALRMKDDPAGREKRTAALGEIIEQCSRCTRIVQSVLRFSNSAGAVRSRLDVDPVVRLALRSVRESAAAKDVALSLEVNGPVPSIDGDGIGLERAVTNLLQNSIDACSPGGNVAVGLEQEDDHLVITVTDDGSGIEPDVIKKLFDPFFTTKTNTGGTGLGLSIAHGIVEAHGGSIDVKSEPGKGAAFLMRFPVTGKNRSGPA